MSDIVDGLRACAGAVLAPKGSFIAVAIDPQILSTRFNGAAEALERVFIGGNHLGIIIGADHPPHTADHDEARKHYTDRPDIYEAWCCWKSIMEVARSTGLSPASAQQSDAGDEHD